MYIYYASDFNWSSNQATIKRWLIMRSSLHFAEEHSFLYYTILKKKNRIKDLINLSEAHKFQKVGKG